MHGYGSYRSYNMCPGIFRVEADSGRADVGGICSYNVDDVSGGDRMEVGR